MRLGVVTKGLCLFAPIIPLYAEKDDDIDEDQKQRDQRWLAPVRLTAYGNNQHGEFLAVQPQTPTDFQRRGRLVHRIKMQPRRATG